MRTSYVTTARSSAPSSWADERWIASRLRTSEHRSKRRGPVENVAINGHQIEACKLPPRMCNCRRTASQNTAHNFDTRQLTRHTFVLTVLTQKLA